MAFQRKASAKEPNNKKKGFNRADRRQAEYVESVSEYPLYVLGAKKKKEHPIVIQFLFFVIFLLVWVKNMSTTEDSSLWVGSQEVTKGDKREADSPVLHFCL